MNEETKKLITAGMLSDVVGEGTKISSDGIWTPIHEYEGQSLGKGTFIGVSEAELKDKLKEWIINYSGYRNLNVFTRGEACVVTVYNGSFCSEIKYQEAEVSELEALLKLYNAVKGE